MSIKLNMRANKEAAINSDVIKYTLVIKNTEDEPIDNVEIVNSLSPFVTLISGTFILNNNKLDDISVEKGIIIPSLFVGANMILAFKVKVNSKCNYCNIFNKVDVKYLLGGVEKKQSVNNLIKFKKGNKGEEMNTNEEIKKNQEVKKTDEVKKNITSKNMVNASSTSQSCSALGSSYVIPGNGGVTEVVLMTDSALDCGIMALPGNVLSLSADAVKLLNQAFNTNYPSTVQDLNPTNDYDISNLLVSLNNAGVISLTSNPPMQDAVLNYTVAEGEVINIPDTSCPCCNILDPIPAPCPGNVICLKLGFIRIYIYLSDVLVSDSTCSGGCPAGYNAISTEGPFGISVYPQPVNTALGSNCGACGVCGVCGGCALCGPSAILGAASSALLSTIALMSSIAAFSANMGQN